MKGLKQRAITAIIFVAIILAGIFGGEPLFIGLAFIIATLCSFELLGILLPKAETKFRKKVFGMAIALTPCIYMYGYNCGWVSPNLQPIGLLGVAGSVVFLVELFGQSEKPFANSGSQIITLVYIGVPLALMIDLAQTIEPYNPILLLSIFVFTWANDTGAYFVGSWIGKHKLFERISPKKTIEGFIGGVILSGIAGIVAYQVDKALDLHQWIILGIIVGITATLGDLIESMLKRSMKIKDSGSSLPGHGGFLDRFDGFVFAIPFAYFYLKLFV